MLVYWSILDYWTICHQDLPSYQHMMGWCMMGDVGRTVGVGRFAEGEEVHDGVVHLQNGRALAVHHRKARPSAHCVIRQPA